MAMTLTYVQGDNEDNNYPYCFQYVMYEPQIFRHD